MRRLAAISGFDAKGPACFLVEIEERRLLLDLGEGPDGRRRPDLTDVAPVDAILISHGHRDHAGALDLAGRLGSPPVYATPPVAALGCAALSGAGRLPMAGAIEVAGVAVETGPAGHAPGAVWLRIGGAAGLLYTGDLSDEGPLFPHAPPPPARALVFDASYGAAEEGLEAQAARILALAREGPLLLPAPAAGRGLEMAVAFARGGVPVALCPEHRAVAWALLSHGEALRPGGAEALRHLLDMADPPGPESPPARVTIAASPDAERGLAAVLVARFTEGAAARVVFTGHLREGSRAAAMVAAGEARFLRWNAHPTLGALRGLVAAVGPAVAMPAFAGPDGRAALAAVLRPLRLATGPEMAW